MAWGGQERSQARQPVQAASDSTSVTPPSGCTSRAMASVGQTLAQTGQSMQVSSITGAGQYTAASGAGAGRRARTRHCHSAGMRSAGSDQSTNGKGESGMLWASVLRAPRAIAPNMPRRLTCSPLPARAASWGRSVTCAARKVAPRSTLACSVTRRTEAGTSGPPRLHPAQSP